MNTVEQMFKYKYPDAYKLQTANCRVFLAKDIEESKTLKDGLLKDYAQLEVTKL